MHKHLYQRDRKLCSILALNLHIVYNKLKSELALWDIPSVSNKGPFLYFEKGPLLDCLLLYS